MKTATLKYPSADGKTAIRALVWEPDAAEQPEGSETSEGCDIQTFRASFRSCTECRSTSCATPISRNSL